MRMMFFIADILLPQRKGCGPCAVSRPAFLRGMPQKLLLLYVAKETSCQTKSGLPESVSRSHRCS